MTLFANLSTKACTYAIPLTLLVGMGLSANAAKVYKWVDENGRTHYSQTPPPKKVKRGKEIKVNTYRSRAATPKATSEISPEMAESTKKQDKANPEAERIKELEQNLEARDKAAEKQRCEALLKNKDRLSLGGQIYEMEKGQRKYLSGAEIDAKLEKVNTEYRSNCQ